MKNLFFGTTMTLLLAALMLPACQKESLTSVTDDLSAAVTERGMRPDSGHCHGHDTLGWGGHHPHDSLGHVHDSLWIGGGHPHDSLHVHDSLFVGGGHHPHDSTSHPIDTTGGHGGHHGGGHGGNGGHGGGHGGH